LRVWDDWKLINGRNGYTQGSKHITGVTAYRNPERPDMGRHVIYPGKAIQRIKEMYDISAYYILQHHIKNGHNIARIDMAIDFLHTGIAVQQFVDAFDNGHINTRLRSATIVKSLTDSGYTFYLGSRKARKKLVRIYDKGAETNTGLDWVRVEVQLMGKPATQVSKLLVWHSSLEAVLLRSIKDVIDCPTIEVWRDAFSGKEPIKLQSESDIPGNTREWLDKQVFPALKREISLDAKWWVQYKMALEA
jgi:DNA relaxase NicK